MFKNMTRTFAQSTPSRCRRCGTCCLKGGPALHREDLALMQEGFLMWRDLCTLRAGEPVHDQILGRAMLLESDCVKIRAVPESNACSFFRSSKASCACYAHRPLECRALKCWDTTELAQAAGQPRLSRPDILGNSALVELIQEHENRCDCGRLMEMLRRDTSGDRQCVRRALAYDAAMREVLVEQGVGQETLEFLLGRRLDVVIQGLVRWLRLTP